MALAGSLAACTSAPPTSVLTPLPPAATDTAISPSAMPTDTSEPRLPTSPPALTLTPVSTTAASTPVVAATPGCVDDAEFVADLTVPDGAQYLPGQTFVKKWSVRNTGTCDWGPGYRLVFVSGDALTALPGAAPQTEFALYPARAGTLAPWEIVMRAPDLPGEYTGRWQARDPDGNLFGKFVFVKIEVVPLPATDTPAP